MLPGLDTCWHVGHNGHFPKQKTSTEQRFEIRHDTIQYFKAQKHTNSFDDDEQNDDQNGNSNIARGAPIWVEMMMKMMMMMKR